MRWPLAMALGSAVGIAAGQEPAAGHPKHPAGPAIHAPHPALPPEAALDHVRSSNRLVVAAGDEAEAPPLERPAGAGRFVVAVLTCAESTVDVPRLLGLRPADVLVIRNAGATCDADTAALVEWAATTERLSLCIVLTHEHCVSLTADPRAPILDRGAAARALAERRHLRLTRAQALVQSERLLAASDGLRRLAQRSEFRVVGATVDATSGAITWHTSRADDMAIAPVR